MFVLDKLGSNFKIEWCQYKFLFLKISKNKKRRVNLHHYFYFSTHTVGSKGYKVQGKKWKIKYNKNRCKKKTRWKNICKKMQAHVQDKITQVKHLSMIKRGAYNGSFSKFFFRLKWKVFFLFSVSFSLPLWHWWENNWIRVVEGLGLVI